MTSINDVEFECALCKRRAKAEVKSDVEGPVTLYSRPGIYGIRDLAFYDIVCAPLERIGWVSIHPHRKDERLAVVCPSCAVDARFSAEAEALQSEIREKLGTLEKLTGLDLETPRNSVWLGWANSSSADRLNKLRRENSPEYGELATVKYEVVCQQGGCGNRTRVRCYCDRVVTFIKPADIIVVQGYHREKPDGEVVWYPGHRRIESVSPLLCPEHLDPWTNWEKGELDESVSPWKMPRAQEIIGMDLGESKGEKDDDTAEDDLRARLHGRAGRASGAVLRIVRCGMRGRALAGRARRVCDRKEG